MRLQEFPRHPLTFGPSPVHQLERLTSHLGGAAVWAKREDCNSGLAYGGNKTRKLEYRAALQAARDAGYSAAEIATPAGVTRQAVLKTTVTPK